MQETEVILLALDGALGTRARVLMRLPKVAISRDERVKAIVLLWVGVDDAAIGRIGATIGEMGARGKRRGFPGSSQRAAPLDAQAIIAEASPSHWETSGTDRDVFLESQGASISQVVLVTLIEGDDESRTPTSSRQTEVPNGIVGGIQGSNLDGEPTGFPSVVEGGKSVDGIVTVAVGDGNHQGKLTAMLEGVGGEFVETVAVDPALAVAVPAPQSQGITVGAKTRATVFWFLALIVTGTELLAVRIGPSRKFAAVTGDVEVVEVDEAQLEGTSDKAGKEDGLENAFIRIERGEVAMAFEDGGQG